MGLAVLLAVTLSPAFGASAAVQEAVALLRQQDFRTAEAKLRTEVNTHPADAEALSLLGVALDEQQKFTEGRVFHERAVAAAPRSTAVLYNYANNLLATGDEKSAREILTKSLTIDPANPQANLAMAQIALNHGDGKQAMTYLDHLPDEPTTAMLRLPALDLAGRSAEAKALFDQVLPAVQSDPRAGLAFGLALEKARQCDQAEAFLTQALAKDPANFQILYHLGVNASNAGHHDKAVTSLEAALTVEPKNADALYALALVESRMSQPEQAIRLLAQAAQIAPQRADVQKLIAIEARNIKADQDSVDAWDKYLKLMPNDEEAQRERAFGMARLQKLDEALPELRAYVARHPNDAVGFYELGMTESVDDPGKAIERLNRAIELQPEFVAARAARGILLHVSNQPEKAVADLQFAVDHIPEDAPERAPLLDRLGQALVAMDRVNDAVPVLRKASQLAPDDPQTLLHLANALAEAGKTEESDTLMARFRQMDPGKRPTKVAGIVDYLSLSPEARHDLYRARLEKAMHDRPDDISSQILYLKLLLSDNQIPQALDMSKKIAEQKPGSKWLADAGHALIGARQYAAAKAMLDQAAADSTARFEGFDLDRAIAAFYVAGGGEAAASVGLDALERVPAAQRGASYYLARAGMLEAKGDRAGAITALRDGVKAAPEDVDLYWQASVLMVKDGRAGDALRLLGGGAKALQGDWQIPVIRAMVLEASGNKEEARRALADAQRRWPEAAAVWESEGSILVAHGQEAEGRKALANAKALGAHAGDAAPMTIFNGGPPREW
ncbi:MAG TPA: tetratricopeptide repeat protein [Bryobacteraceae bacterium]|nr:tetratricopeptide repeat protein [Bryobacteraceae bacterium]